MNERLAAWLVERERLRAQLWRLLGDLPPLIAPAVRVVEQSQHDGWALEKLTFDNGAGAVVPGYLLIPDGLTERAPALLYCHVHGNKYELGKAELFHDGLIPGIQPGIALARAGFVVLAIDAYGFGERHPCGERHDEVSAQGLQVELSLCKRFLWRGQTLWGMMLRDDLLALNILRARREVDPARIGVTGMSLGGSRSTWLAALDDGIAALAPIAQLTRCADYDAQGDYTLHGMYYYLPGMLTSGIDMEQIVSLAAPRPQLILIGDSDRLSPIDGVRTIIREARQTYALYGAESAFAASIMPQLGHQYTPEMFSATLSFFRRVL
jgi:dienelactone hydrolase